MFRRRIVGIRKKYLIYLKILIHSEKVCGEHEVRNWNGNRRDNKFVERLVK